MLGKYWKLLSPVMTVCATIILLSTFFKFENVHNKKLVLPEIMMLKCTSPAQNCPSNSKLMILLLLA